MSQAISKDKHSPGDREVFIEWMTDHRGVIMKVVRGFTTTNADADDLYQNIAMALGRSISSFRGDAKPSTWIWRIALNQAITWQRSAKPAPSEVDEVIDLPAPNRADDGFLVDRIFNAIQALSPVDRSLIMLSLEGFSYAESAEITGLTETNVGARLTRARTRLTSYLEESL